MDNFEDFHAVVLTIDSEPPEGYPEKREGIQVTYVEFIITALAWAIQEGQVKAYIIQDFSLDGTLIPAGMPITTEWLFDHMSHQNIITWMNKIEFAQT